MSMSNKLPFSVIYFALSDKVSVAYLADQKVQPNQLCVLRG